jgi:hypothetical protein
VNLANALAVIGNACDGAEKLPSSGETLRRLELAMLAGASRARQGIPESRRSFHGAQENEDAVNYFRRRWTLFPHGDVYTAIEPETVRQDGRWLCGAGHRGRATPPWPNNTAKSFSSRSAILSAPADPRKSLATLFTSRILKQTAGEEYAVPDILLMQRDPRRGCHCWHVS